MKYGPTLPISEEIQSEKHRQAGETFEDACRRRAHAMADGPEHEAALLEILLDMRFLEGGRVQSAMGSDREVTAFNCFVSGTLPDSMKGIMTRLSEAAETMRRGGGIGYDFSTLRPRGELIKTLHSMASGAVSFMEPFDAVCGTISSAGHRRGAQMGVLRVDHPDIEEFIEAKCNDHRLKRFNISVAVTDKFMAAVIKDDLFDLVWEGKVYKTVLATDLWDKIMRATWDWAEPGVLFIDRINEQNNLRYCETIAATNPCGEQPLPPFGACLLGSFNATRYVYWDRGTRRFNTTKLVHDIPVIVRAMDNVIDRTSYPLDEQEAEAKAKRRMGLGFTGQANAFEALGFEYGSEAYIQMVDFVGETLANEAYRASALLAKEKGAFPLYEPEFLDRPFPQQLQEGVKALIEAYGTRNSHLISIAPTGTISLSADNVSSGIEPVFSYEYDRTIQTPTGPRIEKITDYGVRIFGVKGKTADQLTPNEHVDVLCAAQKWVDSACSKTCNIGPDVTFEQFKSVYMRAYRGGAKGCTTFRANGKRFAMMTATEAPQADEVTDTPAACYFDPETGQKSCS